MNLITYDNGKEFASHTAAEKESKTKMAFKIMPPKEDATQGCELR